jgi:hypothetical protein
MLSKMYLLLTFLLFICSNAISLALQSDPTPETDSFYNPPERFEDVRLGSILRYRRSPHTIRLNNVLPYRINGTWQILYRTQNSVGRPEATVVTVLVPSVAKKKNLFSLSYFTVGGKAYILVIH